MVETRNNEDIDVFRKFMFEQHKKFLKQEINKVLKTNKKVDQILNSEQIKQKGKGFGMSMISLCPKARGTKQYLRIIISNLLE